jgi:uncharacterized membrane protein
VKVPQGQGAHILQLAQKYDGENLVQLAAEDQERRWDFLVLQVANAKVGPLLAELEELPQTYTTLVPHDVVPTQPPAAKLASYIKDLSPRSPLEVWINGLQSMGSWSSYLSYAVAASIVVWIGMFANTIFLLVAAMLIAPFAGPAMNVAIATASGDWSLLWRNTVRYFAALGVTVAVTALLSILLRQGTATLTMVNISEVSSMTVLLPLVTGAAGALNLVQPERSSLVSGTAVGLLVAAALAPPAGLIGMAAAIGRWDMTVNAAFKLMLQLVAINLSGALVFRLYGLSATDVQYGQGRYRRVFYGSLAVTSVILAGLLFWQFSTAPNLQRSTLAQRAVNEVGQVVQQNEMAELVEANLRFTRPSLANQETLLGVVYVQRVNPTVPDEVIQQTLTAEIQTQLQTLPGNIVPLVSVTVLDPPPQ